MRDQVAARPAGDEGADRDRQEREAHVGADLVLGREVRDVLVEARGLDRLADGEQHHARDRPGDRGDRAHHEPAGGGEREAEDHGLKRRQALRERGRRDRDQDDRPGVDRLDDLETPELQVVLHVEGQRVEDVPEHRPEAREDHEERDEAQVAEDEQHVGEDLPQRPGRRCVRRPRRLLVEERRRGEEQRGW